MNIRSLMDELFRWCEDGGPHDYSATCDTLKAYNRYALLTKEAPRQV